MESNICWALYTIALDLVNLSCITYLIDTITECSITVMQYNLTYCFNKFRFGAKCKILSAIIYTSTCFAKTGVCVV